MPNRCLPIQGQLNRVNTRAQYDSDLKLRLRPETPSAQSLLCDSLLKRAPDARVFAARGAERAAKGGLGVVTGVVLEVVSFFGVGV